MRLRALIAPGTAPEKALGKAPEKALALFASLGLALLALLVTACGSKTSPDERNVLLATEFDDQRVGEDASEEVAAEMGIVSDPQLVELVEDLGVQLARGAPSRSFSYRFAIVDQSEPNAFALPGGFVYVSRGVLALAGAEDELANVIGHEITHAAERHAAARQEIARRTSPFLMPALRFGRVAAYSRDQERDADRGGELLAASAGYDPMGMASFLKRLARVERLASGHSRLPGYFDTHPGTTERIATATQRASEIAWTPGPGSADPDAYLRRLEGMVLGPNPAEGVFRGSRFLHPDLNFALNFPEGWNLVNTSQAVGAISPNGEARIFMMLDSRESDPERAASLFMQKNAEEYKARVQKEYPVKLGGIDAYRIETRARAFFGKVSAHLTFIPYGGLMYRLTAAAPSGSADEYLGRGRNTARSFRSLNAEERASFRVLRLRLVEAGEKESLAALGLRASNAWDPSRTAVLNGVFVDVKLDEGQLVKIARSEPYTPNAEEEVELGTRPPASMRP